MFLIISKQVIKMSLIILVGIACRKTGIVTHEGNKTLSNLLLLVINPLLIVQAFEIRYTPQLFHGLLLSLLLAVITHVIAILLSILLYKKEGNPSYVIERFSIVYSNCGFMGVPLINSILGSEGVLYISAFMVVFNLLVWTHGLLLMTEDSSWQQLKKGLRTPMMFAILFGIVIFLGNIRLPDLLSDTISYLAAMNTPLAMLIAGIALAETDLLHSLTNPRLYFTAVGKLVFVPLVMIAIFALIPMNEKVLCTSLIAAACPTASTCTMFALRYDKDYRYASEIFAISTLFSLVTIPLLVLLIDLVIM